MKTLVPTLGTAGMSRSPFARISLKTLATALTVWRERRALEVLDKDLLRDIGLTAEQARREAGRPIWDLPQGR
ncbi:MAG: hypothetical protein AAF334_03890 [Pseudomonadota bacterium]